MSLLLLITKGPTLIIYLVFFFFFWLKILPPFAIKSITNSRPV